MTKKEQLEILIKVYSKAIWNLKLNIFIFNWRANLIDKSLLMGVCGALNFYILNKYPDSDYTWISEIREKINPKSPYWYKPPLSCKTKKEAIKCLQFRLNILKEELKKRKSTIIIKINIYATQFSKTY